MKSELITNSASPRLIILPEQKPHNKLVIRTSSHIHLIDHDQILYLQAMGNYTKIFTERESVICSSKTLKHYATQLRGRSFMRPHQSFLVNVNKIAKLSLHAPCTLTLSDGVSIPVSRSRKNKTMELFA